MNRKYVILLSLVLLFSTSFISNIICEDDPFAGMDVGGAADTTTTAPADFAVPADAGADPFADSGAPADGSADMAASADVLFPDDPAAGGALPGEAGAGDSGVPDMGGDMGMGMPGDSTLPATGTQTAPPMDMPGETPKAVKKSGSTTHKGATKTDDIYTKSGYIGSFRHLREIMDWGIKATSQLSPDNDASKLGDNIVDTAWIEAKKDGGKKQVITFSFDEKYFIGLYEKKYHKVKVSKLMVLNGNATDKASWKKYFRVKKLKITQNKKLKFYIMLHDTMNWQTITLKKPLIVKPGDVIRAEIMDVFPETRREDDTYVAITEFTFLGEPYGAKVEPKYVPNNLDGSK